MSRRLALAFATLALLFLTLPSVAAAAKDSGERAAEQRLIETYAPRLMLREGDEICDTSGEQYEATTVNTVLGNPAVKLTEADEDGDETTLKHAPTAADIAGLGDDIHLNIPGDPLGDTAEAEEAPAKKRWRERLPRRAATAEA